MKAIFGVVSLLVVLAIAGVLASRQMKAVGSVPASTGVPAAANANEQSRQMQERVRQDLNKALEQGAAKRDEVDK
jgi:Tfp pilus assembly protein PilE